MHSIFDVEGVKPIKTTYVIYMPDRRIKAVLVKNVKNTPENIDELNRVILSEDCRIINFCPSSLDEPFIDICYFIECGEGVEERVVERIKFLGFSKSVMILDIPSEHLALTPFFPYVVSRQRAVIMREPMYRGLFKGIRRRLGEGAAKVFLRLEGIEVGKEVYRSLADIIKDMNLFDAIKTLFLIGQSLGYCFLESLKMEDEVILASLRDMWEGAVMRGEYSSPQCFFSKGIIEGFMEALTGGGWIAEEVECIAMGNKRCTFLIQRERESGYNT